MSLNRKPPGQRVQSRGWGRKEECRADDGSGKKGTESRMGQEGSLLGDPRVASPQNLLCNFLTIGRAISDSDNADLHMPWNCIRYHAHSMYVPARAHTHTHDMTKLCGW